MANATSPWSSSEWSPSPLAIPASARPASPPNWPGRPGRHPAVGQWVWRVLRRHGLSTRAKRSGLVAGSAAPPTPQRPAPAPERHLDLDHPGQLVQLDCCSIGRRSGTKGTLWQDTAIAVASASTRATLRVTRRNPSATWTSQLARQVAADPAARGGKLERVMSDNASEFRSATFQATVAKLGARHSFIRAGRKQMGAWSGSSRPSWTSAGSQPLPAL
jgi:transposase InsO family protein